MRCGIGKLLTVAAVTAVAGVLLVGNSTQAAPTLDLMATPFAAVCVDCAGCWSEGDVGHKAPDGDGTSIYDRGTGSHTTCYTTGTCSQRHPITYPNCGGTNNGEDLVATLEEIRQVILAGDQAAAVAAARSADERHFRYVEARNAIQVAGCDGNLIAHLPL
jgi:hypothetical protein